MLRTLAAFPSFAFSLVYQVTRVSHEIVAPQSSSLWSNIPRLVLLRTTVVREGKAKAEQSED